MEKHLNRMDQVEVHRTATNRLRIIFHVMEQKFAAQSIWNPT